MGLLATAASSSAKFVYDYKHVFICGGFYNSIADLGFFIGIFIDVVIIAAYSACRIRNPGPSDFGFQMLVLEFVDAIPEAMFIGESIVDGSIALPVVLAILTLNIVNTMCTGFDLMAPGSDNGDDAEVELVLRDHGVRPPVIFGAMQQPHRSADVRPLLGASTGGDDGDPAHGEPPPRKKKPTHLALFCLINFSMGNILLSMIDEIYVEFEKSFENTAAGWLKNSSLILGTVIGTATVMLIIAGNAGMKKTPGGCCSCCSGGSSREPTFWSRLLLLVSSFLFVSFFAVCISGACGLICKVLHDKNVVVMHPLFEGFSGGAFIGAVAGIMVPESTQQLRHSGFRGAWTQMFGMIMFVGGITIGMLTRELLFTSNPVLWEYCHVTE